MKRFLKNKMGVSPIISTTLIFAILMTGVLIMYGWGLPLVIDFQDNAEVNDVTNQFYELDRNIKIVIHEGDGATRSSKFEFNKGLLNYTSSSNFSLILVSGDPPILSDPPDAIIEGHNDIPDLGRMEYTLRSTMDDLAINSSSSLTGAVDAYPVVDIDNDAHDAGVFAAFEEAEQNIDISRIVYTRSEFAQYSLFLEYRPVIKITATGDGRVDRLDVWLYLVKLDNIGSFPEVGTTEIIVKRIDYIKGSAELVSSNIQDQDNVYLYAIVDGVYQQLTLDFEVRGSFSLYQHIVTTEIQIYDI